MEESPIRMYSEMYADYVRSGMSMECASDTLKRDYALNPSFIDIIIQHYKESELACTFYNAFLEATQKQQYTELSYENKYELVVQMKSMLAFAIDDDFIMKNNPELIERVLQKYRYKLHVDFGIDLNVITHIFNELIQHSSYTLDTFVLEVASILSSKYTHASSSAVIDAVKQIIQAEIIDERTHIRTTFDARPYVIQFIAEMYDVNIRFIGDKNKTYYAHDTESELVLSIKHNCISVIKSIESD